MAQWNIFLSTVLRHFSMFKRHNYTSFSRNWLLQLYQQMWFMQIIRQVVYVIKMQIIVVENGYFVVGGIVEDAPCMVLDLLVGYVSNMSFVVIDCGHRFDESFTPTPAHLKDPEFTANSTDKYVRSTTDP